MDCLIEIGMGISWWRLKYMADISSHTTFISLQVEVYLPPVAPYLHLSHRIPAGSPQLFTPPVKIPSAAPNLSPHLAPARVHQQQSLIPPPGVLNPTIRSFDDHPLAQIQS